MAADTKIRDVIWFLPIPVLVDSILELELNPSNTIRGCKTRCKRTSYEIWTHRRLFSEATSLAVANSKWIQECINDLCVSKFVCFLPSCTCVFTPEVYTSKLLLPIRKEWWNRKLCSSKLHVFLPGKTNAIWLGFNLAVRRPYAYMPVLYGLYHRNETVPSVGCLQPNRVLTMSRRPICCRHRLHSVVLLCHILTVVLLVGWEFQEKVDHPHLFGCL